MKTISKSSAGRIADTSTFVLSAETPDRVGDVVVQRGIDLSNFKQNPVVLVSHDRSQMPVGVWKNLRIQGDALLADLSLAKAGTSRMADLARELIDQGILRAVSVGFRSIEAVALPSRGMKFIKSELLEASLVSVPMHPRAVMVAKSLDMSDDELKMFFEVPVDTPSEEDIQKSLDQSIRFEAARKRGIYALIHATRLQRKSGEL